MPTRRSGNTRRAERVVPVTRVARAVRAVMLAATLVVAGQVGTSQASFAQTVPPAGAGDIVDDPNEKAADLQRAVANGGVSPDRLIVVYGNGTAVGDPVRLRARQQVGGRVLRADGATGRD